MKNRNSGQKDQEKGHAVLEIAMLAPWIFFLFVGVLDFGFYAYSAVSTTNSARGAALYTSASTGNAADTAGACQVVLAEMQAMPNARGLTSCVDPGATSASQPVGVLAQAITGPDGSQSSQVTVTYRSVSMIPIPGLMTGQMTITRVAQLRVLDQW
jgi:uncharacterized iron-regulated membrane protein